MILLGDYYKQVLNKAKLLLAVICLFSISITVISLQYSESSENDGLVLCESMDSMPGTCETTENDDADNDNETVWEIVKIDLQREFKLSSPVFVQKTILLPEYSNHYLFSFSSDLLRPPSFPV